MGVLTQDMRVDAQRYGWIGMAEARCYDVDRHSRQQQRSGVQVPEIMKPSVRQGLARCHNRPVVPVDQLGHQCGNRIGIERLAPLGGEHKAVGVSPGRPSR